MELEAVGGVSMSDMGLEISWEIDDIDGAEGAFLRTDTAANTQTFRNESNLRLGSDFDTEASASNNRT
jgi:hypothetical protein